jgi:hypothetical protein
MQFVLRSRLANFRPFLVNRIEISTRSRQVVSFTAGRRKIFGRAGWAARKPMYGWTRLYCLHAIACFPLSITG